MWAILRQTEDNQHPLVLYCDLIEGSCETAPQLDMECLVIAMLFCVLRRLKKGRGTVRSLLTVQGTCKRNSLPAFASNISLTTYENLQAAKEKQNIPAKSHSSGATDVKKHQACVNGLDQQILKQHHLPLDCWEDWWRAQTMLRWLTETWMDTTRKHPSENETSNDPEHQPPQAQAWSEEEEGGCHWKRTQLFPFLSFHYRHVFHQIKDMLLLRENTIIPFN